MLNEREGLLYYKLLHKNRYICIRARDHLNNHLMSYCGSLFQANIPNLHLSCIHNEHTYFTLNSIVIRFVTHLIYSPKESHEIERGRREDEPKDLRELNI